MRILPHIICFILSIGVVSPTNATEYLSVPAGSGDGVISLLRRYNLEKYSCNATQFYELNNLSKDKGLILGRYYKLPIELIKYNGKSIRSTTNNNDLPTAQAIQAYNEEMHALSLRNEDFRDDKILWIPFHVNNCPTPDVMTPVAMANEGEESKASGNAGSRIFPIFGKDHEKVALKGTSLQGDVFYICAGHGGPDPGAMGKYNKHTLCEDEYSYDISLRLALRLVEEGATVYIINRDENDGIRSGMYLDCDNDEVLWGDVQMVLNQKKRLTQRSDIVNERFDYHAKQGVTRQIMIEVHVDSRSKRAQTDLFFYYHPSSKGGKVLSKKMHSYLSTKYKKYRRSGEYSGTVTGRDLHMLREIKPVGIYIELGNIQNAFDQKRILLESNRQALANWLFESLGTVK